MKKLFLLATAIFTLLSCSKDGEGTVADEGTVINLSTATNTVVVDDLVTVQLTSSKPMKFIQVSSDNINFINASGLDATSRTLYFTFDKIGSQTKYIRITDENYKIVTKSITFNVIRNNTIRIKGVIVNSFYNINQTWDPEFSATDPNRLADVYVAFGKPQLEFFSTNNIIYKSWYYSAIKENQGDLTWDLTNESLYFRQNSIIQFSLADLDSQNAINPLIPNSDRLVYLDFTTYIATKPSTITFDFPLDQLQFILTVDWQ